MYEMMKVDVFDKTILNCESMNLSYKLFEDVDYTQSESIVSFYRCDFRGSKINNCIFYKNPFGRSDFIDTYICNSKFREVNWGSCLFENASFENTQFSGNRYKGVSAKYTYFKKCIFSNETIISNMFDCLYQECTFVDCIYEKSSILNIQFINCTFIRTDISQCHAEQLKFDSCTLQDVYLGLPFWATYLFKNTFINRFAFKYHGEIIDIIRESYFLSSFKEFWENGRLYEYINAHIISKQISMQSDLLNIVKKVFQKLIVFPAKIRKKNILDILSMFEFYFSYDNIDFITYNSIIEYLNLEGWKNYPFDEVIEYSAKIFKINVLISNFKYDYKYLYTINTNQKCICNFRLDCKDKEEAIKYLDTVFNVANDNLCNGYYDPPLFEVKDISVGSIILTISSWALLAILVSYSAKKVFHNLQSIKIEHALNVAIQKQLSDKTNPTTINDIDKVGKIAAKYNLINTDDDDAKLNKLSSELTKGEILSIILNLII
ncbi:pentapeptide repeat-containing protein [Thomasclavelia cocleata]|uniref:pentapeptide repeat-containing protein n=2 Tax=Bacillota TaxID=1239 RepID=UPI00272E4221|nr:pentapeptide repeat-containing protein [Thomasclavelia cocleata]